jgi:hypothetical protein
MIAVPVNVLVIDAMPQSMAGSVGFPVARSANPVPADQVSSSPQTTPAALPGSRFSSMNEASLVSSSAARAD